MRVSTQYFPFAPGIPFKVQDSSYIIPKLSQDIFHRALNNKDIVLVCYGGLLECIYSFAVAEAFWIKYPDKRIYWCGYDRFKILCELYGKVSFANAISDKDIKKYPSPFFFDESQNYILFNLLLNYKKIYDFGGKYIKDDKRSCTRQIFSKSCLSFDPSYLPNLHIERPKSIKDFPKKYIFILPDEYEGTIAKESCLNWQPHHIRSFATMFKKTDYKLIIMSNNPGRYYGLNCQVLSFDLITSLFLIKNCSVLLSKCPDFLFIGLLFGGSKLFYDRMIKSMNLYRNAKALDLEREIKSLKNLKPIDVFERIIYGMHRFNDGNLQSFGFNQANY